LRVPGFTPALIRAHSPPGPTRNDRAVLSRCIAVRRERRHALRLFDGEELTKLIVRYNVGVQVRETFDLKEIDEDAFEE
jgi:restriction system protein